MGAKYKRGCTRAPYVFGIGAATQGDEQILRCETADLAFEHVAGLSREAAHVTGKNSIDLAGNCGGEFTLQEVDGRLGGFLRVFLTDAGFLDDDINELLHPHAYDSLLGKQSIRSVFLITSGASDLYTAFLGSWFDHLDLG